MFVETIRANIAEGKRLHRQVVLGSELLRRIKDAREHQDPEYLALTMQMFEQEVQSEGQSIGAGVSESVYKGRRSQAHVPEAAAELGWNYRMQRLEQLVQTPTPQGDVPATIPSLSETLWSETVDKADKLGIKPEVVRSVVDVLTNPG